MDNEAVAATYVRTAARMTGMSLPILVSCMDVLPRTGILGRSWRPLWEPESRRLALSLPPEMAENVTRVMREEGRTMSELVREALRLYMDERELRRLERYGRLRAREQGIAPEDVERLVDEHRAEGLSD